MTHPDGPPVHAVARGLPVLDRVPPVGLVMTGITTIQFGAALSATLFDDLGPSGVSLLRLWFAALILTVLARPRVRGLRARELRLVAIFGLTLGAMNLTFYEALARIPLGALVTIEFIGPLAVAVFKSHRRLNLLWAAFAAGGVVLLANPGAGSLNVVGLLFAGSAAALWASYILIAQSAGRVFSGSEGVALAMLGAALVPAAPGIVEGGGALLRPDLLATGFAVALLSSAIPYSLETEALRRLPAHVFGIFMSLEPACAALAGFIVLGQSLGPRELIAIALVVAASTGVSQRS